MASTRPFVNRALASRLTLFSLTKLDLRIHLTLIRSLTFRYLWHAFPSWNPFFEAHHPFARFTLHLKHFPVASELSFSTHRRPLFATSIKRE